MHGSQTPRQLLRSGEKSGGISGKDTEEGVNTGKTRRKVHYANLKEESNFYTQYIIQLT